MVVFWLGSVLFEILLLILGTVMCGYEFWLQFQLYQKESHFSFYWQYALIYDKKYNDKCATC